MLEGTVRGETPDEWFLRKEHAVASQLESACSFETRVEKKRRQRVSRPQLPLNDLWVHHDKE